MKLKPFKMKDWLINQSQPVYIKAGKLIMGFKFTGQYKQGDKLLTEIACFVGGYSINKYSQKVCGWLVNGEADDFDQNDQLMLEDKS